MNDRFYITTPIYYVNAEPHLGHAYSTVVADVQNRFHRLIGHETFFLTGTDEHGDKIVQAAQKMGLSPKEYTDVISDKFRRTWPLLNIHPDRFIRTTDPQHIKTVQMVLQKVYDQGDIEFREYEGLYCFGCERFLIERELEDGKCPDHKVEPTRLKEKNYFFLMSKYQQWLIDHIKANPEFIGPERYRNEVLSFLKDPLDDLCISRPVSRLTWGVPLPFDENFVTYVWFDALINYLSGLDFPDGENFKKFWPVANHVIAKDILKPHGIYWPIMLHAIGLEPYQALHVHGYWKIKEEKMSKSLGNIVRPGWLVENFGADATRYCLMREMSFGLDASFSYDSFVTRINADLANDLGNLFSRSVTMLHKFRKGVVPVERRFEGPQDELRKEFTALVTRWKELMEKFQAHNGMAELWRVLNLANKVIDQMAPWQLAKEEEKALLLDDVMYCLMEGLRLTAVLIWPVMPKSSEKMLESLGLSPDKELTPQGLSWGRLEGGEEVKKIPPLFPRIGPSKKEAKQAQKPKKAQKEKEKEKKMEKQAENEVKFINIDDFSRVELRVAEIVSAEKHPNADRLLKLTVKAPEERTIVAGIADHFSPDSLVGKKVVIVSNLKPVKLRGVTSQGMLLVAKDKAGLHLLEVSPDTESGAPIS